MHTLLAMCRLCLLLLAVKTLAEDHRLQTPESDERRTRRQPKWSHFFVMHEPRSEEKDKAQGFFYQVGSGPPIINRLRSTPPGFQSQTRGSNMVRYNPVLHSPFPNQHQSQQQFGSRMPDSFGARMPNLPSPVFDKPQLENPTGERLNPEIAPDNVQNFQSGSQGISGHEVNFPENLNAPLQFGLGTLGGVDSKSGTEVLKTQGPVSSHATLHLQGNQQNAAALDDSSKDSPVSVKGKPSFVVGGQSVFGKRNPLPSHLAPVIPPENNQPVGESSIGDNSDQEQENLRLLIAQHIPTTTGHILPVLVHPSSEEENTPNQNNYGKEILADNQPQKKESIDLEGNLREKEQLAEIRKQSISSGWQLQPQLNPQNREGTPESFFENPGNGREREPTSHDFEKPPYQTHHEKESGLPHHPPQKYNYLPVSQQYAHGNNAYNPPSLFNFNTNIHLHGASPVSPNTNFQQELKQPSHSLSVHPHVLERPVSEVTQPALQKDVQTSNGYSGRIPSSQIYLLGPSKVPEVPLVISGHQNGPYRQDNRGHFGRETNLRTPQTPSHLTAIFPVNLPHSKENVGQRVPQNVFTSNANEKTSNVKHSDILVRNQPQDGIVPSVNPGTNTASHSIRLFLPQQQLPQFSPTDVSSGVPHALGAPNRFQTHQVSLLPNSHGYVQTQVQLPPLNFRFQLTPVKDDSNGSFGDISDSQKIAQPTFQPIPYQYQLPLQPVPIQRTHQLLFPNLQIANVPLETPKISSDEGQKSISESADAHTDLPEKPEPVTRPSVVEDAVDKEKTLKEQIIFKEDSLRKSTEDQASITSATTDEINMSDKGEVLKTTSPTNSLAEKEDKENDTKEDTVVKFPTPHESKVDEKAKTESKNADTELNSSTVNLNEKDEVDVSTTETDLELTTKSQFSVKPNLDLLSVLTFTEIPKLEDGGVRILDDVTTGGTKLAEEKSSTSGDSEISSVSADDSADISSAFPTIAAKAPTTVSTTESTTLEQSTQGLTDNSVKELSTFSEAPATVSTRESTTLEQPAGDLLPTKVSEAPATVSTRETTTLKQSAVDLADKSNELSTTTPKVPITVSTTESTALEQSTDDFTDKSSKELLTTTAKVPTTVSSSESTMLEQDRTSTIETELNTGGASGTSDLPQEIRIEDSTISNPRTDSTTSTVAENAFSTESPRDSLFFTRKAPSSTDTTTAIVTRTNDISVNSQDDIVTELSKTTSESTVLSSRAETTTVTKGITSDSATETSVSLTEPPATKLPDEIVTTSTMSSTTEENILSVDQPLQTETNMLGELETVTSSVNQTSTDVLQTSTGGTDRIGVTEIVSLPDISSTMTTANASDTDAANEIEQFFTTPAIESSSTSSPKVPTTTGSFGDKFSVFNELSVFTFTEAPVSKRKTEKTNVEVKGMTPEEKSKDSGTQTDSKESGPTEKVESAKDDTSSISTSVSKDSEISLNEISVVLSTTQTVDDAKDEEGNKQLRGEVPKDSDETTPEPKLKTTKPAEDRAIFTFVGKTIPQITEEETEFSWVAVTSSSSVSTEDSKNEVFTEKVTETTLDHEIPLSTPNTETQTGHQGRAAGKTNSKDRTSDPERELLGGLNGRERNENEVSVVETSRPLNSTEYDSDADVRSDTDIAALDNKEKVDTSEKEQTTTATIESQNPFIRSSETPTGSNTGSSVISETSTDSKRGDSSILETTTNDAGNNKFTGSSDGRSQETPMIIDNDALELLLNNLVTPRNISILAPVTSTSISILLGIPTEIPEQISEDKKQLSENAATGQNNDIFGLGSTSATAINAEVPADNTDIPESDNGSSFFSKVFGKSLLPLENNKQNSPEDKTSEVAMSSKKAQRESSQENAQSQSSQTSSATEAPGSLSETQVTSASVSPETEMPVSDRSSVKLTALENFEGRDIPDFTEILKQHAR